MDKSAFEQIYRSLKTGYRYRTVGQIGIFTLPEFEKQAGIDHGFSARTGGVSRGYFSSLNLSFTRPEDRENVMENYRRFCSAAAIPEASMVMDNYEHGTTVFAVDAADCGKGYTRESLPFCDGLVTNDPRVTLVTGHADCMAFYFYDPVSRSIGLCHAGWRGALGRIGCQVVQRMREHYGALPENIFAGLGPSICGSHFEVGADVADAFCNAFPDIDIRTEGAPQKAYIDLWRVAAKQFLESGILPEHISLMQLCTVEDDRLFSHRGDHGHTGGMSAYLRLM